MLKRIISCIIVAALVFTVLPMTAFANNDNVLYGDVNCDGEVDPIDVLVLKHYIVDDVVERFSFKNADVNVDGAADPIDILMIKKFIADLDIRLGPDLLTVSFYDDSRMIESFNVEKGQPLGDVPDVSLSSKANAILEGYYTDKSFTQPFYADNPVEDNLKVYAKYAEMSNTEQLNLTSFAQMDKSPELSFEIKQTSGNILPENAATLTVKDGSAPVVISITDENNDGIYTVKAPEGFNEGCSYELALADGWCFKDKEETIRTASFSIAMKEVENLQMSDGITYIKDTDSIFYTVAGKSYAVLTSDIISQSGGTFDYTTASGLNANDIICIYVGKNPTQRDPKNGAELLDPAVYVKVQSVIGNKISFEPLGAEDQTKLYNVPDNFPITVSALPTENTGTANISNLERNMYGTMIGADGTYEKALEKIAVGDFVTLFVSEDDIQSENNLYFGQITAYNQGSGEIIYKKVSRQTILDSMDLYSDLDVAGDDLITEEEKSNMESVLLAQVKKSDFATEAATILSDMVTKTDGFRNNMTVKEYLLSDKNGKPLSDDKIKLLNLGGSFELSDDISLTVELITKGDQLHYKGGVQLAIKVDANFEVELSSGGKIVIDLSASFVEEVQIDPSIRGGIVTKEILWIPVPIGVSVNATIDIRNFTAFSFAAEIYTVAPEQEGTWDKIKKIANNPREILGLPGIPDSLKNGLKTMGDVMDKIEEIEAKIDQAADTVEQINGYKEDVEALWAFVENNGLTTEEAWKKMGKELGKTSVAADLLGLMNMTTETSISTEYLEDMQALMDKYSEMVQKETDWIDLVNKEMFFSEVCIFGLAIGVSADFIVRADMSIAIGSNLEYEIGKRYNFWFKIGLFKPSAGSSTMDLLDEHFAFQFYIMGRIGLKVGVRAKVYVGIGSGKFASVGIAAELGPYIKIYGFFVYEYSKFRPAGTQNWTTKERMAGALYIDFGLYFKMGFEASALGDLFEYTYDFVDIEIPLLTAGESRYFYSNSYKPEKDEKILIKDEDSNSATGITMKLPDNMFALSFVDLDTGIQGSESLDYGNYIIKLSNPNFTIDSNGIISVNVPDQVSYMDCDLTITYRYGKMAFSQYDMSVTIPLFWTSLSATELTEYYTASVRVGNDTDGYQTVWTKRVLKNQQYDLPTDAEIRKMIGWSDAKYEASTGYNGQQTSGRTLIEDTVYDYTVNYKKYSLTVNGIQNKDGSTRNKTYTAKYGEAFDFSDLAETGTVSSKIYTKFSGVSTTATIKVNGKDEVIDLTQKINGKISEALLAGLTATAEYVDDSVTVTFSFTGLDHDDVTQKIQKNTTPSLTEIEDIVSENGLAIKDITPSLGKVNAATVYQVTCGELVGESATVTLNENGGNDVLDITKVVGSLIGTLPEPERAGYSFGGWYQDNGTFQNSFSERKMPAGGAVLYAKWTANDYIVTFNVNGGNEIAVNEQTKTVTYDKAYGTLPTPTKSGYGFAGWFTSANGGVQITTASIVSITAGQTLYAHWKVLKSIPSSAFDFGAMENVTYSKGTEQTAIYSFDAGTESYKQGDFTFKYMRQGNSEYEAKNPINAGTYNVTVSRAADNDYAKFEYTYVAVITINKAVRTLDTVALEAEETGYTYLKLKLAANAIDDLSDESEFRYIVGMKINNTQYDLYQSKPGSNYVGSLKPSTLYNVKVEVTGDPNYEDAVSNSYFDMSTLSSPTDSWSEHTIPFITFNNTAYISKPEHLAYLAEQVNAGVSYSGLTFMLTNDIDMSGHSWVPIGNNVDSVKSFSGIFKGQGYTIYNLYMKSSNDFAGLFLSLSGAKIQNVILGDSYLRGYIAGGIAASCYSSTIDSCINYATVVADSEYAGGIAGFAKNESIISNCVNRGIVSGITSVGGIVGLNLNGASVVNCVNSGEVSGENEVGGIVGNNFGSGTCTYNCYSNGSVDGSGNYIGAICGRNEDNKGDIHQCYYLVGSASCNGSSRNAVGTKKGSLNDGEEDTKTASFVSPESILSRDCEEDVTKSDLITTLNHWATRCNSLYGSVQWVEGEDGYPLPVGLSIVQAILK